MDLAATAVARKGEGEGVASGPALDDGSAAGSLAFGDGRRAASSVLTNAGAGLLPAWVAMETRSDLAFGDRAVAVPGGSWFVGDASAGTRSGTGTLDGI